MQYRKMGAADLEVSAIGFGCWEMGGTQYGAVDDGEEAAAVHRGIDLGVTLFDTAAIYGQGYSEVVLGRALGARRKEIVLVTKGGLVWDGRTTGSSRRDSGYWALTQGLEASLHRLGTDYVDLFLIHWPDASTPLDEAARGLAKILESGKARYVGVSNFSADQLREIRQHVPVCANQVGYNLFDRRWERQMFATARELGVGVMAYGPMAHGLLTGTFRADQTFGPEDWRRRGVIFGQTLFGPNLAQNVKVVEQLKGVAADLGASLPRLALAWVLRNPAVTVALSGCRTVGEIEENVKALEIKIPDDALARIEEIMQGAAGQVNQVPGRHHLPPGAA